MKEYQIHGDIENLIFAEQTFTVYRNRVESPLLQERVDTELEEIRRMKAQEQRWQQEYNSLALHQIKGKKYKFVQGAQGTEKRLNLFQTFGRLGAAKQASDLRRASFMIAGGFFLVGIAGIGVGSLYTVLRRQDELKGILALGLTIGAVGGGIAIFGGLKRARIAPQVYSLIQAHNLQLRVEIDIERAKQAYEGWSMGPQRGVLVTFAAQM